MKYKGVCKVVDLDKSYFDSKGDLLITDVVGHIDISNFKYNAPHLKVIDGSLIAYDYSGDLSSLEVVNGSVLFNNFKGNAPLLETIKLNFKSTDSNGLPNLKTIGTIGQSNSCILKGDCGDLSSLEKVNGSLCLYKNNDINLDSLNYVSRLVTTKNIRLPKLETIETISLMNGAKIENNNILETKYIFYESILYDKINKEFRFNKFVGSGVKLKEYFKEHSYLYEDIQKFIDFIDDVMKNEPIL